MRDYNEFYLFLDVHPPSSQAEIGQAYQRLIGDARRQGGFLLDLTEAAYRCLGDPAKRAQYDAGTYPRDLRVAALRESNNRDGRTAEFDAFPRLRKIHFYQAIFDDEEVTVQFEMLPNGKWRNTRTGEIVDQL